MPSQNPERLVVHQSPAAGGEGYLVTVPMRSVCPAGGASAETTVFFGLHMGSETV